MRIDAYRHSRRRPTTAAPGSSSSRGSRTPRPGSTPRCCPRTAATATRPTCSPALGARVLRDLAATARMTTDSEAAGALDDNFADPLAWYGSVRRRDGREVRRCLGVSQRRPVPGDQRRLSHPTDGRRRRRPHPGGDRLVHGAVHAGALARWRVVTPGRRRGPAAEGRAGKDQRQPRHGARSRRVRSGPAAQWGDDRRGSSTRPGLERWREVSAAASSLTRSATNACWTAHRSRLRPPPPARQLVADLDGQPVAGAALFDSAGVAGIYNVVTVPEARGRGIGRAVTATALVEGVDRGRPRRPGIIRHGLSGLSQPRLPGRLAPAIVRTGWLTSAHLRLFRARVGAAVSRPRLRPVAIRHRGGGEDNRGSSPARHRRSPPAARRLRPRAGRRSVRRAPDPGVSSARTRRRSTSSRTRRM